MSSFLCFPLPVCCLQVGCIPFVCCLHDVVPPCQQRQEVCFLCSTSPTSLDLHELPLPPIDATLVADLGMVVIAAKLIFGLDSDFVLKELLSFLEQKKMPSIIYGRKFCPVGLFPAPIYFYWFSMNRQKYTWQGTGNIRVPYSPARWDLVQLMHLSQECKIAKVPCAQVCHGC